MKDHTSLPGRDGHVGDTATIGIVTVSDRASTGAYEDEGGPAILGFLEEAVRSPAEVHYRCVPDEVDAIVEALTHLCDEVGCDVVVTTGGTGPAPRDVTPSSHDSSVGSVARRWCSTSLEGRNPSGKPSTSSGEPCRTPWT